MDNEFDFDGMTLIPPGSRVIQTDNRVVIVFPNENDAIMFKQILNTIEKKGKPGDVIPVKLAVRAPE